MTTSLYSALYHLSVKCFESTASDIKNNLILGRNSLITVSKTYKQPVVLGPVFDGNHQFLFKSLERVVDFSL